MTVAFLTIDEVLAIHAHQIDRYGGSLGIRDIRLLELALAMPRATFSGQDLVELVLGVAGGDTDKPEVAVLLKKRAR
jgi:prophage maintenance system killer protein